mmetsp:Transcript_22957/g.56563  ORF Transcript_22957/g.56563 Transcript_22957/m.56563 type:complete len:649 (+) Transcript_22957:159-2105(+)
MADIDESQWLKDFCNFVDVIIDSDKDENFLKRTFDFLSCAKNVTDRNVQEAKDANDAFTLEIKKTVADAKHDGDASDGVAIAGAACGIFAAILWFVPGGQTAAALLTAASMASTPASIGAGTAEMCKDNTFEETIKKDQLKEENKLAHNEAFNAMKSIGVLTEIDEKYKKNTEDFKYDAQDFYMALAATFLDAQEHTKDKMEAFNLFKSTLKQFSYKEMLKEEGDIAYWELTDEEKRFYAEIVSALKDEDEDIWDDEVKLAKAIKSSIKLAPKFGQLAKLVPKGIQWVAKGTFLAYKGLILTYTIVKVGFTASRLLVIKDPRMVVPLEEGVEMVRLAWNMEKATKGTTDCVRFGDFMKAQWGALKSGEMLKSWKSMSSLGKGCEIGGAVLDVAAIVISGFSLAARAEEDKETWKKIQDAQDAFQNSIELTKLFQEVYFPRPGDEVNRVIDSHRQENLGNQRNAFDDGNCPMGFVIENKSRYSFNLSPLEVWDGGWYYSPETKLTGTGEIKKLFEDDKEKNFETFVNEKNFTQCCCVGGSGFDGMFILKAEGENPIQIPVWFYYGSTKPWEMMAAYANMKGFYVDKDPKSIYYHMRDEAAKDNKVHIWRWATGDTEGSSKEINNYYLKISFSNPDRRINMTIEDAPLKK